LIVEHGGITVMNETQVRTLMKVCCFWSTMWLCAKPRYEWMGECLQTCIPSQRATIYLVQLIPLSLWGR